MPLPAANRLPLRKERDRLTHEGKSFHTRHFTLVTAPTPIVIASEARQSISHPVGAIHESPAPRFSILLSKKTARLAVDRNRIKRITSALLSDLLPSFPPADYMVIPKRSVLNTPHPDLLADLSSLLPKLK
ncbi:MAG: Ribonuclease P protein component [Microgenomates group bacterium GW2011_GWC1_44_37]|uniref:Ribonuclease P protein component n=1 Tax=Candidatus Collierbacteria bacterium GW2011_GWB2_44_22 TaxID=1618387 RepID=A0A0G1HWI7_9BACT|nr:MAG: Ribonuclease P protein component [Candidatus Collierbacteria bacterium GW2011_GWA2_44_13]KKT51290.1 MAG: Ribonuclease P protein component [Candidatus Collierbacteria bacterium GW2011_GWB2_44_22]KKT61666.1 MAG: Ribonuclease P protein component [Candidatus Collierbacteria bacterium GW2011_GWD1_44_27]KKT68924.1 MAG: Ribonuclease P protein component [Microgenomates group bacterium GW2011_GWC1_44_37]KKT87749.1 MAG: Ribonuclease P protein component [Candidatus Collierbacteria bacterium GW2011